MPRSILNGWGHEMRRHRITLSRAGGVLLLCAATAPLQAETEAAAVFYGEALVAMRGEDYNSALKLFSQAQRAGLKNSTLHYNRGVAYYKLGDYRKAKTEFLKAEADSSSVALVHYNLGLTAYRMEQNAEARQWFLKVAAAGSDRQLTDLADEMVARIDEKGAAEPKPVAKEGPWNLSADLRYGQDDNVTLENGDLATASSLKDGYLDLYATVRYQLSGDRERGYWGQFAASSLQYRQYDDYDYTQYDLGLFRDSRYGTLDTRAGLRISRSEIGGSNYLQKYTLRVQGDYPLGESQTLRARYDISRYDPIDSRYDYLAGLKGSLNLESLWRMNGRKYTLGYALENNNRNDYYSGSSFISYSASRHELSASVSLPVAEGWQLNLGGDYRKSRYNDADISAGVTTQRREDDRWRFSAGAEYRLNRYLNLVGEYDFTDNDSNVISRRYQRNQYSLGVRGYF